QDPPSQGEQGSSGAHEQDLHCGEHGQNRQESSEAPAQTQKVCTKKQRSPKGKEGEPQHPQGPGKEHRPAGTKHHPEQLHPGIHPAHATTRPSASLTRRALQREASSWLWEITARPFPWASSSSRRR